MIVSKSRCPFLTNFNSKEPQAGTIERATGRHYRKTIKQVLSRHLIRHLGTRQAPKQALRKAFR